MCRCEVSYVLLPYTEYKNTETFSSHRMLPIRRAIDRHLVDLRPQAPQLLSIRKILLPYQDPTRTDSHSYWKEIHGPNFALG